MKNRFGVLHLFVAIGLVTTVTAIDCNNRPDFKNLKECCPHDNILTNDITEMCKSFSDEGDAAPMPTGEPGGPGSHGKRRRHRRRLRPCYDECTVNGTGIINLVTMEVNESKAEAYYSSVLTANPDFVQVFVDAWVSCGEKGKEMRAIWKKEASSYPSKPRPSACKPWASMLLFCVKKEWTINCPTNAWLNDEACNNAREYIMTCKSPPVSFPRIPPP